MSKTDSVLARFSIAFVLVGATAIAACGDDDAASGPEPPSTSTSVATSGDEQQFPDILDVAITPQGDTFRFDVTISSPYDTPERYADAWRIVAPDGTELGVRELTHDHAAEQPFTRSLTGVVIPGDVTTVTVEGRDLLNGWGGTTLMVTIEP
ncbi:MAG: hypothetical protein E4H05_11585 [Acidimicrobiales bacterium]|nr:MAG: hypothetical protein E4H05_11585 [Acidimicrobiales bacterium]